MPAKASKASSKTKRKPVAQPPRNALGHRYRPTHSGRNVQAPVERKPIQPEHADIFGNLYGAITLHLREAQRHSFEGQQLRTLLDLYAANLYQCPPEEGWYYNAQEACFIKRDLPPAPESPAEQPPASEGDAPSAAQGDDEQQPVADESPAASEAAVASAQTMAAAAAE